MLQKNHTWYLMSRCLSKEASEEEQAALEALLCDDAVLRSQYEMLQHFWGNQKLEGETEVDEAGSNMDENVKRILYLANIPDEPFEIPGNDEPYKENARRHRLNGRTIKKIIYIAAAACILFFVTKIIFSLEQERTFSKDHVQTITAQNGIRTRAVLPDGSVVWLNSGSKMSYAGDFKDSIREVTLEGEAYFDVVKNPGKPFIVHASNINIRVLGTAFNVKSYSSDSTTETTLIRGLVQISNAHQPTGKTVYLHPNEKIVVSKKTESIDPLVVIPKDNPKKESAAILKIDTTVKIEDRIETAWVYNRLVFHGETFKELAVKLERWYNIKIDFTDEAVSRLSFNGSFENETVEEAFNALQAAVPFSYKIINNHEILISTAK